MRCCCLEEDGLQMHFKKHKKKPPAAVYMQLEVHLMTTAGHS